MHTCIYIYRCDGKVLRLSLFKQDDDPCGSLTGLHSSDIAYIQQAATHVLIKVGQISASAEIMRYGASNKGLDVVNIKFDNVEVFHRLQPNFREKHECDSVHFILKHKYFRNLHRSLDRVTAGIIKRLIPEAINLSDERRKLQTNSMSLPDYLSLDNEYQLPALKKMMACDSNVPFLVTGPFGTGKTRLLAAATVKFLEECNSRILLCTSHLKSADAYIDNYFGPLQWVDGNCIPQKVEPIRLVSPSYDNYRGNYHELFTSISDKHKGNKIKKCRLIITTFLTAPHLIHLNVKPFTHILIDEGGQLREPEAIAPLGLADDDTKIVIAGDHLEV